MLELIGSQCQQLVPRVLNMNSIIDNVSIDRLKPSNLLNAYGWPSTDSNDLHEHSSSNQHNILSNSHTGHQLLAF